MSCAAVAVSENDAELRISALSAKNALVVPSPTMSELDSPTPTLPPSAMPPDSAFAEKSLCAAIATAPVLSMLVRVVEVGSARLCPTEAVTLSSNTMTANEPCTATPSDAAPPIASA